MSRHPLLLRQLRRSFGEGPPPPGLEQFLLQVDAAYTQFDHDRKLTEHVMDVSSRELTAANSELLAQNRRNGELLARLRKTLSLFQKEGDVFAGDDLIRVAEEIERLVSERKEVERVLISAKAASDSANRAKSEFVANMSHEIRTPLNAVVGMTNLLLDAELPAPSGEYVGIIRQSCDSLLDIINDILDFSKIEAGRMEMELLPCDIRATVEQVLDVFSDQAKQAGLDLGACFPQEMPASVLTDPTRLRQILVNLVGNAIKFTSSGGIGIFVTARQDTDCWDIGFAVEDTGIGIPADRLDRLFKAFTQVDGSTTRKYGGTGLGLAITAHLVALLGGEIGVESNPGQGSRFYFSIVAPVSEDAMAAVKVDPGLLDSRRVLVVDDIAINRRILQSQLGSWGMESVLADRPEAAIERMGSGKTFDIVLLDFNMPGMNGGQLARELNRLYGINTPPMVILSSRGTEEDEAGGLVARRLTKPVKPSELLQVICEVLTPGPAKSLPAERSATFDPDFSQSHPLRILVADDVAVNRKVILLYLSRLGYHAAAVNDGNEAIERLRKEPYDVVLMDLLMPELDGIEAAKIIRRQPGWEDRPYIIALTANVLSEHHASAVAAGMQDFLCKPLRPEALIQTLRTAYSRIHESDGAPA